jgi:LPXTG-site transpeptidase (sortase) family protein
VTPEAGVTIGTASPYTDANAAFFNLTGQTMTLTFGSFTSTASSSATNRTVTVTFLARVDNVAGNQSGTSFTNSVDLVRTNPDGAGTVTLTATAPAASVVEPDLNVSKSVSSSTPAYNSTLTYTLDITHTGSSDATAYDMQITDTMPAGLTSLRNVNVSSTAGGCATVVTNNSTGTILDITIGSIPLGCSVAIMYDVTVSGATSSTQTNSVTAAWTSQAGSVYERTGADGASGLNNYVDSDSKSVTVTGPDLRIIKTDGNTTYTAGSSVTYTIDVYNDGSAAATGTIADTFSAKLTGVTWTCAGTGGATCTASGSGNINDSVSIPVGQGVTYTVSTTVVASATGDLVNTATATLSAGTDPTPANNTSTDTDTWNNLLPVAVPDTNTANEGGSAVTGDIRSNDTLGDTPTTVTAANQGGNAIPFGTAFPTAAGGSLMLNANGTYSYTPPATLPEGGALTEVFNYTITDANGDTSSSTLTITVDRLPQANPDTNSATEGGSAVTGNTITNDDEGNISASVTAASQSGATITLGSASTTAAGGSLTLDSNGSYSYTPPVSVPTAGLTEVFNYTITDADGNPSSSTLTITVNKSLIGISKQASTPVEVSAGTYDITYTLLVKNYGGVTLNNIQVTDNLSTTFASPTTFSVQSKSATGLTINPSFNGSTDTNLLTGMDSLSAGASGTITVVVRVLPLSAGPFNNTAIASGRCPTCTTPVSDNSQTGTDPDPDHDNDPTNNNAATPVSFGAALFDPPFGLKIFDDSGLPLLQWTMVWINNSNIVAVNAQVSDSISSGTTYSASGVSSGYPLPAGAPAGSTAVGVSCTDTSSSSSTTYCYYEGPTATYTRGRIVWVGTLGPDLGATDAASANNEITITFNVDIDAGTASVQNTATVDTDLDGDTVFALSEQRVASAARTWSAPTQSTLSTEATLPATGFAPNVVTDMSNVPPQAYLAADDVTVEIPNLNIKIPIVGVPKKNGTWNVSWLGNQAGWLEGSAFPSWNGNSVLTGHVYLSNGLPGPFVNLSGLKYGDKIIIHAYGQKYTFEVRTNDVVRPNDTSVMKHEEKSWLTLVTCKEYDEKTNTYRKRVVVRAVLVNVTGE